MWRWLLAFVFMVGPAVAGEVERGLAIRAEIAGHVHEVEGVWAIVVVPERFVLYGDAAAHTLAGRLVSAEGLSQPEIQVTRGGCLDGDCGLRAVVVRARCNRTHTKNGQGGVR